MNQRFMLDTNIVSNLLRNPSGAITSRIDATGEGMICTSLIVACELRYGAKKKASATLTGRVDDLLAAIEVLPLEPDVDDHYGDIRCALEAAGTPIGANDLMIAAHARAVGATLITDNVREFIRVPGLRVENWLHPADGGPNKGG